ncbi:MAG: fructose-bisphosphatase class III, partial [Parasporobacterium sp.]|nr:fructose-bisphosphatase class III [Parasporobacterium sp.]
SVDVYGKKYSGKALYDILEVYIRKAFFSEDETERQKGRDILWFLWSSPDSPLFGREKMATFESYFVSDSAVKKEKKNKYYQLLNDEASVNRILREFGLPEDAHIVNGHVPVLQSSGESPVKCGGKVLIIDGGFSRAYQSVTGIAGYTLIYNSYGMQLVAHKPFTSKEDAIVHETDIHSDRIMVMNAPRRMRVADTDDGKVLKERILELRQLLKAYRSGMIGEKS